MFARLSTSLCLLLTACSASAFEEEGMPLQMDAAQPDEQPVSPDITIEAVPTSTSWASIPVRGIGPSDGVVIVKASAESFISVTTGPSGSFCLDVPLAEGDNEISLRAVSAEGIESRRISLSVVRTPPENPSEAAPTPEPTFHNAALGGDVTVGPQASYSWTSVGVEAGEAASLTDGYTTTSVRLRAESIGGKGWVVASMANPGVATRIRIASTASYPLEEFRMYVASTVSPPAAGGDWTGWRLVAERTDAGPLTDWGLPANQDVITHVAIDFTNYWYLWEVELRELTVWVEVPAEQADPIEAGGPTCAP